MDSSEFSRRLQKLQTEIFYAIVSYRVYIALWPNNEHVEIINYRIGFFKPVWNALYHKMVMGFANVSETGRKAVTLGNLLREAENHRIDLVPNLSANRLQGMRDSIERQKPVLKKISRIRNKELAHLDVGINPLTRPTKGEMDRLITTIEEVFNGLSSGHDGNVYSWSYQADSSVWQTAEVLRILEEDMLERKARAEKALQDSGNA